MKTKQLVFIFSIAFLAIFSSCKTSMVTKSPYEVKQMTTMDFSANKDIVYKSAISLIQSEAYIIQNTDKETGLINAYKRLENKNEAAQMYLLGFAKGANTSKLMFYIDALNSSTTEVKITLYEGKESESRGAWGNVNKQNKEQMVYDATVYSKWFNNLKAEIEKRKALEK